jgi:hypothetical protein
MVLRAYLSPQPVKTPAQIVSIFQPTVAKWSWKIAGENSEFHISKGISTLHFRPKIAFSPRPGDHPKKSWRTLNGPTWLKHQVEPFNI